MDTKDRLLSLAHQHNIGVFYFPTPLCRAYTVEVDGSPAICLDRAQMDSMAQECTCMAHEIGHAITGSLYMPDNPLDCHGKHERRAWRWAVHRLLPKDKLRAMIDRCAGPWEVAEEAGVTEDFVRLACEMYFS